MSRLGVCGIAGTRIHSVLRVPDNVFSMENVNMEIESVDKIRLSWHSRLRNHLTLYHPIVWWRALVMKNKPLLWSRKDVLVLLSTTFLGIFSRRFKNQSISTQSHRSTMKLRLFDDRFWNCWTLVPFSYLLWKTALTAYHVLTAVSEISKSRCVAHPDACDVLYQRLLEQRAHRFYSYDIYLPPLVVASSVAPKRNNYILFLPGAYVDPVAYAQPASLLSDAGFIVVVVSSEPLGIVDTLLPRFCPSNLQSIQRSVEEQFGSLFYPILPGRWILMGHSMGSLACTKLASHFPSIKDVVLWGSVPFLNYMGDLSHLNSVRVFVVQASKDIIMKIFCTPEAIQEFWNRLPKSTVTFEIIDGSHSGFGSYISSFVEDPDGCLDVAQQHFIAVQETVRFLSQ
jgi:Alpha/beta hydrolase family